jgi:hypothetical protein
MEPRSEGAGHLGERRHTIITQLFVATVNYNMLPPPQATLRGAGTLRNYTPFNCDLHPRSSVIAQLKTLNYYQAHTNEVDYLATQS